MEWVIIGLVALFTGITAAMGLGGGFILVIYLTVFAGMPQLEAQGVNLVFFIPIAAVSLFFHIRNKLVEKSVILLSVIAAVLGVFIGVWAANWLGSDWLRKIFAGFVLLVGIRELVMAFKKPKEETDQPETDMEIKEI